MPHRFGSRIATFNNSKAIQYKEQRMATTIQNAGHTADRNVGLIWALAIGVLLALVMVFSMGQSNDNPTETTIGTAK
jgi:hypothetical protein